MHVQLLQLSDWRVCNGRVCSRALLHTPSESLIGPLEMVVLVPGIFAGKDKAYQDIKVTCHIATTENAFQDSELQQVSKYARSDHQSRHCGAEQSGVGGTQHPYTTLNCWHKNAPTQV